MPNQIRKEDILDADFTDAYELLSDGYGSNSIYLSNMSVISTTSGSKTVIGSLDSEGLGLLSREYSAAQNDIVYLQGTSGADGYYTIDTIVDNITFTVNESIPSSTGGGATFIYPSGASKIGFDSRGLTSTQAQNLQDAVQDVATTVDDLVINTVSIDDHQTLRQLIHFIDEGPADGFASGAEKRTTPIGSMLPTSVIWYTDITLSKKIVEQSINWTGIVPTTITWQVYSTDGITIAHTVTDNIVYVNNIFETSRTRTIT